MNALTGSALTSEGGKADGSGLMKQQGYILLVPQGTGDVKQGQVGSPAVSHSAHDSTSCRPLLLLLQQLAN